MAIDFFKRNKKNKDDIKDTEEPKNKSEEKNEDEEQKIVQKIQSMYKKSYDSKSALHKQWDKNYKAYTGELFESNLPSFRANEVSNYIFSTIETIKPIMLNDNPKIQVLATTQDYYDKAHTVQCVLDSEWKRTNSFKKLHMLNHLSLIYGTAIEGIFWNSSLKNGLGDVEPVVISPYNFFVEPSASSIEKSEYCMYAIYKKASEIIKAYPEKEEEIKKQVTTNVDEYLMKGIDSNNFGDNNVLYIECYMKDYSVNTYIEEEENEKGEKLKYKVSEPKYPNGRRVILAGDVLLSDEANPYKDNEYPFKVFQCYPQYGTIWGISEVEMLISPQQHSNDIMNSLIENAKLNGNPWTIMDNNCGVERNSLSNRPGLVVRKNPGSEIKREAPPALPSYIKDIMQTLRDDIEEISGVVDVVKGQKPGSITAANAIQALNEQAQGRIKLKVQYMEDFIAQIGSLWLKRIQQFWTSKRTIRVTGDVMLPDFLSNPMVQQLSYKFLDVSSDDIDGDYDIEVFAGSTMQTNKSAIAQTVIQLAQTTAEDGLPMLDRKTVLENVLDVVQNIDVTKVVEKFDQMAQSQAQSQSQNVEATMQMQQSKLQNDRDIANQKAMVNAQLEVDKMMNNKEIEYAKMQHEMGLKNMEHASKMKLENNKEMYDLAKANVDSQINQGQASVNKNDSSDYDQQVQLQEKNGVDVNTLQANENGLQYKENSDEEFRQLQEIVEYLLSLPQEEYNELLNKNPELAKVVQLIVQQSQTNGGTVNE